MSINSDKEVSSNFRFEDGTPDDEICGVSC